MTQKELKQFNAQQQEYEQLLLLKQQQQEGAKASIELPGVKAEVTKDDTWETIGMIVVLVLGIYLGIRLINKFVK